MLLGAPERIVSSHAACLSLSAATARQRVLRRSRAVSSTEAANSPRHPVAASSAAPQRSTMSGTEVGTVLQGSGVLSGRSALCAQTEWSKG